MKRKEKVTIQAPQGRTIDTFVYIIKWHQVEPSLGLEDSVALGLLQINPKGSTVHSVEVTTSDNIHIPATTAKIISDHRALFSGIRKFENTEVNFTINDRFKPVIQRERSTTLTYQEVKKGVTSEIVVFKAHSRILLISKSHVPLSVLTHEV